MFGRNILPKQKLVALPIYLAKCMASKLTLKSFVRARARAIQISLVPICFVRAKAGRHPESFGQVSGCQSINQESCTKSVWPTPKSVWAKYSAEAKACVPPNLFG